MQHTAGMNRWPIRLAFAAALSVALLGLLVLFGWHINMPVLIQLHPSLVPMQYNTALAFLLSGVGLLSPLLSWRQQTAAVCGGITLAIGLLTGTEYLLDVNFGIDQLLMEQHHIMVEVSHPGRMAPNTALCFTLVGIALILLQFRFSRRRSFAIRILGSLIALIGTISFVGYLVGTESAYGWAEYTRMALHTALGFIILGAGILACSWPLTTRLEHSSVLCIFRPKPITDSGVTRSPIPVQADH